MTERIEIAIEAVDKASKELKKLQKGLKGVEKQAKKTEKPLARLKNNIKGLKSQLLPAAVIVGGFGLALKKAFDLGEQGAVVEQTRASFDGLMESIGAAPDILQQLRIASRGTVSDLELMSSTQTLLAGATNETAKALADNLPALLNIAKAAQKLNPNLGDTTFLFNSIATGIKRSQPLILDNLGLTIKIGDANEKYAEQLGITVEELSAQEKQIALLNATLEAGNIIVAQAGGTTESAQDSFRRFEATSKNLADTLSVALFPAISDIVDTINILLTAGRDISAMIDAQILEVLAITGSYEDYEQRVRELADTSNRTIISQDDYTAAIEKGGIAARAAHRSVVLLNRGEFDLHETNKQLSRSTEAVAIATGVLEEQARNLVAAEAEVNLVLGELHTLMSTTITKDFADVRRKVADLNQDLEDLGVERTEAIVELDIRRLEDLEEANVRFEDLTDDLLLARIRMGEFTETTSEASRVASQMRIDDLTAQISEQTLKIAELGEVSSETLAGLDAEYDEKMGRVKDRIDSVTEAWDQQTKRLIFSLAEQRLAIDGFTGEELEALAKLAGPEGLGLIDESAVRLIGAIDDQATSLEEAGSQVDEFVLGLLGLETQLTAIESAASGAGAAIQRIGGGVRGGAGGGVQEFAQGGSFSVPGRGGADSQLVAFRATPGETVTVQPNVTNNMDLTINSNADAEQVQSSFEFMMALIEGAV